MNRKRNAKYQREYRDRKIALMGAEEFKKEHVEKMKRIRDKQKRTLTKEETNRKRALNAEANKRYRERKRSNLADEICSDGVENPGYVLESLKDDVQPVQHVSPSGYGPVTSEAPLSQHVSPSENASHLSPSGDTIYFPPGMNVYSRLTNSKQLGQESENAKTLDSEKIIHDAVVSTINSATSLLNVVTAELLRTEKQHSTELEELFACSVRTLRSAAEAAHTAGAEYVAIAANERIHSAESQIKIETEKTMEAEKQRDADDEQNATSYDEDYTVTKVKEEPADDDYEILTVMEES